MKRKKVEFGTFSNGGLSTGLAFIEFSKEDLVKMENIVLEDLRNIEQDFIENLNRLEIYLKAKNLAIPRKDEFAKWFFDKKKFNQWGKNLPKITDEEIIENAKMYVKQLDKIVKPKTEKKQGKPLISNNLNINIDVLFNELNNHVFKGSTTKEIEEIFTSKLEFPNRKINLQISNKAFVLLLEELVKISSINFEYPSIIESKKCFYSKKGTLIKANNLHQAKNQFETGFRNDEEQKSIEHIIKNIKNIKAN